MMGASLVPSHPAVRSMWLWSEAAGAADFGLQGGRHVVRPGHGGSRQGQQLVPGGSLDRAELPSRGDERPAGREDRGGSPRPIDHFLGLCRRGKVYGPRGSSGVPSIPGTWSTCRRHPSTSSMRAAGDLSSTVLHPLGMPRARIHRPRPRRPERGALLSRRAGDRRWHPPATRARSGVIGTVRTSTFPTVVDGDTFSARRTWTSDVHLTPSGMFTSAMVP